MDTPASMEEAMEELESATDDSETASGGAPNSEAQASGKRTGGEQASGEQTSEEQTSGEQAKEEQPGERQPGRRPAPESSGSEDPGSGSSAPASGSASRQASGEVSEAASLSREASLSFFGVSAAVPYGPALAARLEGTPGKSSIRRFWKAMAEGPYRPTLAVLRKQREEMNLGDWGYYLYLKRFSKQLYGGGNGSAGGSRAASERVLWTWFMMMKSGYAARVGYQESEAILMLPIDQKVFGRPQMHIGGQRYYLMGKEVGGCLRTYEGQHGEASRALRLGEGSLPDMPEESAERAVEFSFQGERHSLDIAYNPSAAEYLRAYPKVGLGVLFSAGVSPEARGSLEKSLRPLIEGRPPRESLNLLLKFAQFATGYKRDQEHFGEERFLFPEETLASDYSDCEDRAVLLGYLAGELLGRDVVGLKWPSHVALAVQAGGGLTATAEDHTVTAGGETYIYADPTYLGSSLGMEMPLIEGQKPEIVSPVQ